MKRFLILTAFLLAGLAAAAQNSAKYEQFRDLRDQADTLGMKRMLDGWGEKSPEYYAAQANYCSVMAELTEDTDWIVRDLQWAEEGLEAFPGNILLLYKRGEAQIASDSLEDALATFLHICDLEEDAEDAWFYITQLYSAKRDLKNARLYAEKLSHSEDESFQEFGAEIMENVDAWFTEFEKERITPDFEEVRALAASPAFTELMARFEACDTTMTIRDVSNLYYANGFRSHPDASAERVSTALKAFLNDRKFQEGFDLLVKSLKDEPLNLDFLFSAALLCSPLEVDEETAGPLFWKLNMLAAALATSGTGLSEGDPIYVNCVQDEYSFLQTVYGMQALREQSLTASQKDRMVFVNEEGLDQTLFFALSPAYWERLESLFPDDD